MAYTYNVIKLADKHFPKYKLVSSGKELTTLCFFCHPAPTKMKLTINVDSGLFHCWKCGKKGNFTDLVTALRRFNRSIDPSNYRDKETKRKPLSVTTTEEIPWPEDYHQLTRKTMGETAMLARYYLNNRGIDDNMIVMNKIGYCVYGAYSDRVIVPIFYKDKLVSFIARDFLGNKDKKILTPPGRGTQGIKRFIYRIESAAKLGHLIITEGVFSALSCGPRGVAIFGKVPTTGQLAQIIAAKPQRVTVALDPDAEKEAIRLTNTLLLHVPDVRYAVFPEGEDPNSLPKEDLELYLSKAKRIDSMMDPLGSLEV